MSLKSATFGAISDTASLSRNAHHLAENSGVVSMKSPDTIFPPQSWSDPDTHYLKAMDSDWYQTLVHVQDRITTLTTLFWSDRGVTCGHLPITTGSVSSPMGLGSDSTPVSVEMFGVKTYLADSMQFGLEYLCRLNRAGAWYLMPSFRGERSDSTHLCQFFHSEAEVPGGLEDVLEVVETYLRYLVGSLLDIDQDLLAKASGGDLEHVTALVERGTPFARLTFDEAAHLLGQDPRYVTVDPEHGWRNLTRAGEREIMSRVGEFVWVTHWDHLSVPFYQARDQLTGQALNADLLFGPGEVVGCGERHATGEQTLAALAAHNVPADPYEWYISMKDRSPLRTAGFGMGVERFLMWLLQQDDIRDMQVLPRENGRDIRP
jgi:aspartyl/asparaginyl-tRNA synthetase